MRRAEFDTSHTVVLTSLGPLGKRKSRAEVLVFAGTHVTRKPGSYKELGCNTTFGSCYAWCWRRGPSLRLLRNENSFLSHVQSRPRLGSVPQGPGRLGRKAEAEGAMGGGQEEGRLRWAKVMGFPEGTAPPPRNSSTPLAFVKAHALPGLDIWFKSFIKPHPFGFNMIPCPFWEWCKTSQPL